LEMRSWELFAWIGLKLGSSQSQPSKHDRWWRSEWFLFCSHWPL
jgi:hypothetical protein